MKGQEWKEHIEQGRPMAARQCSFNIQVPQNTLSSEANVAELIDENEE